MRLGYANDDDTAVKYVVHARRDVVERHAREARGHRRFVYFHARALGGMCVCTGMDIQ